MTDTLNIYDPKDLEAFLASQKLRLTKERGQNFLLNRQILEQMASFVSGDFPILEIGPGMGHLTRFLIPKNKNYYAVEVDKGFCQFLDSYFHQQIHLFHQDFLKLDFKILKQDQVTVAGNIPYSLSLPILLQLLRNINFLQNFYLLVQEEFAHKLLSSPGTENYGRIGVLIQYYTRPKIMMQVPSHCFYPAPKVHSAFVRFEILHKTYDRNFENFVTQLFSARRKTLHNNLKKIASPEILEHIFETHQLNPNVRAEALDSETLFAIYSSILRK